MGRLDQLDLTKSLSRKEEAKALERAQERLAQLRLTLGGQISAEGEPRIGPPVLVLFEGWDASGKGGAIKRMVAPLDPRHVRVASFAAPTSDEKRHHFLWRFWSRLPGWGGMAVFDRTWYGRVLVERVEGLATREQWLRAYDEINNFERTLTDEGTIMVKFWLHISDAEQLKRFERRRDDPLKSWKLTDEDWRNRDKPRRLHGGDRGHDRAHRPAERTLVADRSRLQALGPGGGDRGGQRADRGGDARVGDRAAAAPRRPRGRRLSDADSAAPGSGRLAPCRQSPGCAQSSRPRPRGRPATPPTRRGLPSRG